MNSTAVASPVPGWFRVVAILALLWNLLGVAAFVMDANMSAETIAALPEAQQQLYAARPGWVLVAYGIAVFAGALGCLLLVMRRKLAVSLLLISLLAVLVQISYLFFMSDTFAVMRNAAMAMPILVILVAIGLVWLARNAAAKGWLR